MALILGLIGCASLVATTDATAPRANILMILVDDLGWADVSFNRASPDPEIVTPNLQKLVDEGVHLTRHYVHQYCTPTRTSLQSGRFPVHVNTGLGDPCSDNTGISQNMTGFAQHLQRAGYFTAQAGKWDAGMATPAHTPQGRGYNESLCYFSHKNDFWSQSNMQTCCGDDLTIIDFWETDHGASTLNGTGYSEYIYMEFLTSIIEKHDPTTPLALFYAPHVAHCPLQVPKAAFDRFSFMSDDESQCSKQTVKGVHTIDPHFPDLPYKCRQQYKAMVSIMDEVVGNITDALKAKGMYDNLFIAFSSDNGGPVDLQENAANNWPLRGGKYSLFEGGIRSAAFISGGMLPPSVRGTVNSGIIHVADWYSTFAAIAGVDPTDHKAAAAGDVPPIDSINMLPFLTGSVATSPRAELPIPVGGNCVVLGDYKLITSSTSPNFWQGPKYPNSSSSALQALMDLDLPPRPYPRLQPCYSGENATLRELQMWSRVGSAAGTTVCSEAHVSSPCWNVQGENGPNVILWTQASTNNEVFTISAGVLRAGSIDATRCIGSDPISGELVVVEDCQKGHFTSGWVYNETSSRIQILGDDGNLMCVEWFGNETGGNAPASGGVCSNGCLFDVANDYTEQNNLINDPAQAARVANMTAILAGEKANFFSNKDKFPTNACPPGEKDCACWVAKNRYGGFMGPYAMLDD